MSRSFPHSQVIAICTLIGFLVTNEKTSLPRQREVLLLAALWVLFCFTTVSAFDFAEAVVRLKDVSKIFLMVFLSLVLMNDDKKIHLLFRAIALALGFYGLKGGLFALRTGGEGMVQGPADSFLMANNSVGLALAMNLPLLFYLAKVETNIFLRQLFRAMMIFSYPAIICTFSRGAWLGMAVTSGLLVLKSKNKLIAWTVVGLLIFTSPVWLSMIVSERIAERYDTLANYSEDSSAQSRQWNMRFCAQVGFMRPVGAGFDFYSIEAYEVFYPEFLERWPGKVWSCHSMWLTIWAEHGVVGTVLWISLLITCFGSLRRLRRAAAQHESLKQIGVYADMIQVAFWSFMVSGTFLDVAYFDVYYQLVGTIVLLKERVRVQLLHAEKVDGEPLRVAQGIVQPAFARLATRGAMAGKQKRLMHT